MCHFIVDWAARFAAASLAWRQQWCGVDDDDDDRLYLKTKKKDFDGTNLKDVSEKVL